MPGLFITMEGIDGCGKSTQIEMLVDALRRHKRDVVMTREPGGTQVGEAVRSILTSDISLNVAPTTELFLIVGARAQHVAELIRPSLAAGKVVISDRYVDSTVAFQGHGRGISLDMIARMNHLATGGLMPDATLVFDLDPERARGRLHSRPVGGLLGALDDEQTDFHRRVREAYVGLSANETERVKLIDASGSVEETHIAVMRLLAPLLDRLEGSGKPRERD